MRKQEIQNYNNDSERVIMKLGEIEQCSFSVLVVTQKDMQNFISAVEKMVRGSKAYKSYIAYLKENKNMDGCAIFQQLSKSNSRKIKIEIHHEPFTLFAIVEAVTMKQMDEGKDLNYFEVAKEVTKLHYLGKVGLIGVCKTVHELVHNGKMFIPFQGIYNCGGMIEFVDEYGAYLSTEDKTMLVDRAVMSKEIASVGYQDLTILGTKYIYVQHKDFGTPAIISEDIAKKFDEIQEG